MSVLYGGNRRIFGHVCVTRDRGKGKKRRLCSACSEPHEWLCDGCDAPICSEHAASIRPIDKDFCPTCIEKTWLECEARDVAPQVKCYGPGAEKSATGGMICVAHSLVFTAFLRSGGYERVYTQKDLSIEAKRAAVREWVTKNWIKLNPYLTQVLNKRGDQP